MARGVIVYLGLLAAVAGTSRSVQDGPNPGLVAIASLEDRRGQQSESETQANRPSRSDSDRDGEKAEAGSPKFESATVAGEKLFGYAFIEIEDDLREVSLFSNIVFLSPTSPVFERIVTLARARNMRVAIAWDEVLFDTTATPYRLRTDYRQRFEETVASSPALFRDLVFHQPVDEPYWNGLPEDEMDQALGLMKEEFPGVPTLIVLAWPTLDTRTEPVPSDWVAFDLYYVEDPVADPTYQSYWNRMRQQNPGKLIVVVADGFFSDSHTLAGISRSDMGAVLHSYLNLFDSEPAAVALGVFRWTDTTGIEGTRSLPAEVIREHIAVGSSITNRCGIPADEDPLAGETILWFQDCRFFARVEVDDERTTVVAAMGSALTNESGYFWFFVESNIEITIKVLDGVALNGHYWVFMSDTTDVNYRLEVRDVWTGSVWTHSNHGGAVSVRRDTSAFLP